MECLMVFIAAITLTFLLCVAGLINILLELVSTGCNPERHWAIRAKNSAKAV